MFPFSNDPVIALRAHGKIIKQLTTELRGRVHRPFNGSARKAAFLLSFFLLQRWGSSLATDQPRDLLCSMQRGRGREREREV